MTKRQARKIWKRHPDVCGDNKCPYRWRTIWAMERIMDRIWWRRDFH